MVFKRLSDRRYCQGFEINDQTGRPLTDKDMMERHHSRLHVLQKVIFQHYRKALPEFPFVSSVAAGKVNAVQVGVFVFFSFWFALGSTCITVASYGWYGIVIKCQWLDWGLLGWKGKEGGGTSIG